jgi:hypothetical protein
MAATATSNGNGRRSKRPTKVPDDFAVEALVCPDDHCHHMLVNAEHVKGRPYCAGQLHRKTGQYPRLERVLLGVKERLS